MSLKTWEGLLLYTSITYNRYFLLRPDHSHIAKCEIDWLVSDKTHYYRVLVLVAELCDLPMAPFQTKSTNEYRMSTGIIISYLYGYFKHLAQSMSVELMIYHNMCDLILFLVQIILDMIDYSSH